MQRRSVAAVIILTCITFGIYAIVWFVKTKEEMVRQGADIPTAWLLIVPFASIYWLWKWSGGVEQVTGGKTSQGLGFVYVFLLSIIGMAILQDAFNKADRALPAARVA